MKPSSSTTSAPTAPGEPSEGALSSRAGLLNGIAAYSMWGLVPLFWPLLMPAGPWRSWPTA